jgi:hypothetical protein
MKLGSYKMELFVLFVFVFVMLGFGVVVKDVLNHKTVKEA